MGTLRSSRPALRLPRDRSLRAHHRTPTPTRSDHQGRVHPRASLARRRRLPLPPRRCCRSGARAPPARQPPEIINISWKAQRRLNARWRELKDARRKPAGVVAVAIARELAAYCWEIATYPIPPRHHHQYQRPARGSPTHAKSTPLPAGEAVRGSRLAHTLRDPSPEHPPRRGGRARL